MDQTPAAVSAQLDQWLSVYDVPDANLAHLLCDRHDQRATAFTFVDAHLSPKQLTYGELAESSRKLAVALTVRGVRRGDRVAVLMGKREELVVTCLALWRIGAVHVPLFTAFATAAIAARVTAAGVRLIVTEASQREKVEGLGLDVVEAETDIPQLLAGTDRGFQDAVVGGAGAMVQLFTSGTTGAPKAVVVPVRALASFHCYMHFSLDVTEDDVYWNAADPGWAYGLYYGILGPLAAGRSNVLLNGGFSAETTAKVLRECAVSNFAAAPTVYRALSKSGAAAGLTLRHASSAGEPLTPDLVDWAPTAIGTEIRDHYGQTELGMAICNSWHPDIATPLKPGSMGRAMPGYVAGIVNGEIAVDARQSKLMWFEGYFKDPEKTAERFTPDGRWYLTADTGQVDENGYFSFAARSDDVILAAGYRIGPFDIESVLAAHPLVSDVAAVGRPDPEGLRGEVVEAFVVLVDGALASPELAHQLQQLVRANFSRHAYPRVVRFVRQLPKTPSGKIQRYLLRQWPDEQSDTCASPQR